LTVPQIEARRASPRTFGRFPVFCLLWAFAFLLLFWLRSPSLLLFAVISGSSSSLRGLQSTCTAAAKSVHQDIKARHAQTTGVSKSLRFRSSGAEPLFFLVSSRALSQNILGPNGWGNEEANRSPFLPDSRRGLRLILFTPGGSHFATDNALRGWGAPAFQPAGGPSLLLFFRLQGRLGRPESRASLPSSNRFHYSQPASLLIAQGHFF